MVERKFYIVGGFVRDYVMGHKNTDVDYVAQGYSEEELTNMFGEKIDVNTGFHVWI